MARTPWLMCAFLLADIGAFSFTSVSNAEDSILLRNGLLIQGRKVEVDSLDRNAFATAGRAQSSSRPIWMVDDQLRRVYIPKRLVVPNGINHTPDLTQQIEISQPVSPVGPFSLNGSIAGVSKFNRFGRRQVKVQHRDGTQNVIFQGITLVTPRYIKLEALKSSRNFHWDMRIATTSVPPQVLRQILYQRLKPLTINVRMELVRLYIEAEQYDRAQQELQAAIEAFPNELQLTAQLGALVQRRARQIIDEARLRVRSGQYQLSRKILQDSLKMDTARVTRLEVQELLTKLDDDFRIGIELSDRLAAHVETLDDKTASSLMPLVKEIRENLSPDTITRLSDYRRLGDDKSLPVENRIALAIGGWILGSGSGLENLATAQSLIRVRKLVMEYLQTTSQRRRTVILDALRQVEGADPDKIAKMLPLLPPPLPLPASTDDEPSIPGLSHLTTEWADDPKAKYSVQLPPEYNPLRQYPTIVCLHPLGGTPLNELQWWCGSYNSSMKMRMGQAARHGYIVVAPAWSRSNQHKYEYTSREHHRVLSSVRDAMRRVSIDSDRIFLCGFGEGASAAWDIALAHPDVWAGLISVGGEARKFVKKYHPNSTTLPMYFVYGEVAGTPTPLVRNGAALDRYMTAKHDAMLVMYRGRGGESFYEEIHHFFDWMNLKTHRRSDPPQEISTVTMRSGDRFFWWLELVDINEHNLINPFLWKHVKKIPRAAKVRAKVKTNNVIHVSNAPSIGTVIWLAPTMGIDFSQPVTVRKGSGSKRFTFDGKFDVLLEDARSRADRQQPYWAKVHLP